jgi:hypothetical protein
MSRKRRPYMAARTPPDENHEVGEATPPKMGRPSDYTEELGLHICERIVEGETLRKICSDDDMPNRSTIFRWLTRYPEFKQNYSIAIELHADYWADMAQQIADDRGGDYIEKDGKLIPDWENVQRSRLRVDTIKWRTAKLYPKKYSDRYQISGPGENPIAQSVERGGVTDEQRMRAIEALAAKVRLAQAEPLGPAKPEAEPV